MRAPISTYMLSEHRPRAMYTEPEHQRLRPDRPVAALDELREKGEEEEGHLRVEQVDDERFGEHPLLRPRCRGDGPRHSASAADRLDAEVDQVQTADELHRREGDCRGDDDGRQAGDSRADVDDRCSVHPDDRHETSSPTLSPATGDDEEHCRTGDHQQGDRGGDEHRERRQRGHGPTLPNRWKLVRRICGHDDA